MLNTAADLQFLQRLGEANRNLVEPRHIMATVARMLGQYLNASRCAWADVEANEDSFTIEQDYSHGCESVVGRYSLDLFGTRASNLRRGETLLITHTSEELSAEDGADMFLQINVEAIICCGLIKQGRLTGMMAVHNNTPREWTHREIDLTEEVCKRCWETIERARAEKLAQRSEQQFHDLFEYAPDAMFMTNQAGRITLANRMAESLFGFSRDMLVEKSMVDLIPDVYGAPGQTNQFDTNTRAHLGKRSDGTNVDVEIRLCPVKSDDTEIMVFAVRDVTERLALESQLRQSQKMETVGQLAGGIAHDFNNLLTVITNTAELMALRVQPDTDLMSDTHAIRDAGIKAAGLTRQLLAFSRQQLLQPQVTCLNQIVLTMRPMIERVLGERFEVQISTEPNLGKIYVDPLQLEQVLMNLVLNAGDAMEEGGLLVISTAYHSEDDDAGSSGQVKLLVRDTGTGMSPETQAKIFEPFFTTKQPDKGTGLGLSTVYGIVKQSGGDIEVISKLGHGTEFAVYFPMINLDSTKSDYVGAEVKKARVEVEAVEDVEKLQKVEKVEKPEKARGETVLLVEDNAQVRNIAEQIILFGGYKVCAVASGAQALQKISEGLQFDLMLTDIVMPDMNGVQLASTVRERLPAVKILFTSGYAIDAMAQENNLISDHPFIAKPYKVSTLTEAIDRLLNEDRDV